MKKGFIALSVFFSLTVVKAEDSKWKRCLEIKEIHASEKCFKETDPLFSQDFLDRLPGTLNWCLTSTKLRADQCYERYGGKEGILLRLKQYCGATFKGVEVANIDELAKSTPGDSGMVEVKIDDLIQKVSSLKRGCDSVVQSGGFYICKKDGRYDYLNSSFTKLTKKSCDQVVVDGKSAYCMKKDKGNYTVIESHTSNGKGGATCTETTVFDDPGRSEGTKGVR